MNKPSVFGGSFNALAPSHVLVSFPELAILSPISKASKSCVFLPESFQESALNVVQSKLTGTKNTAQRLEHEYVGSPVNRQGPTLQQHIMDRNDFAKNDPELNIRMLACLSSADDDATLAEVGHS